MASKTDFSEAEWDQLHIGGRGRRPAGLGQRPKLFYSFKEAGALAKHLAGGARRSDSELVRELSKEHGTGFGDDRRAGQGRARTSEALRASIATLEAKFARRRRRRIVSSCSMSPSRSATPAAAARTASGRRSRRSGSAGCDHPAVAA